MYPRLQSARQSLSVPGPAAPTRQVRPAARSHTTLDTPGLPPTYHLPPPEHPHQRRPQRRWQQRLLLSAPQAAAFGRPGLSDGRTPVIEEKEVEVDQQQQKQQPSQPSIRRSGVPAGGRIYTALSATDAPTAESKNSTSGPKSRSRSNNNRSRKACNEATSGAGGRGGGSSCGGGDGNGGANSSSGKRVGVSAREAGGAGGGGGGGSASKQARKASLRRNTRGLAGRGGHGNDGGGDVTAVATAWNQVRGADLDTWVMLVQQYGTTLGGAFAADALFRAAHFVDGAGALRRSVDIRDDEEGCDGNGGDGRQARRSPTPPTPCSIDAAAFSALVLQLLGPATEAAVAVQLCEVQACRLLWALAKLSSRAGGAAGAVETEAGEPNIAEGGQGVGGGAGGVEQLEGEGEAVGGRRAADRSGSALAWSVMEHSGACCVAALAAQLHQHLAAEADGRDGCAPSAMGGGSGTGGNASGSDRSRARSQSRGRGRQAFARIGSGPNQRLSGRLLVMAMWALGRLSAAGYLRYGGSGTVAAGSVGGGGGGGGAATATLCAVGRGELWDGLCAGLRSRLVGLHAREVSNAMWALAVVRHCHHPVFGELVEAMEPHLQAAAGAAPLEAAEMARSGSGSGTLRRRAAPAAGSGGCNVQDLVNAVWALARAGTLPPFSSSAAAAEGPSARLLRLAEAAALHVLPQLRPQHVASLLWSFVSMRHRPTRQLVVSGPTAAAVVATVAEVASAAADGSDGSASSSRRRQQQQQHERWPLPPQQPQGQGQQGRVSAMNLYQLLERRAWELQLFDKGDEGVVAQVVWALVKERLADGRLLVRAAWRLREGAARLTLREAAMVASAYRMARFMDRGLFAALLLRAGALHRRELAESPHADVSIALLLRGLAWAGCYDQAVYTRLCDALRLHLAAIQPQPLALALWALAEVQHRQSDFLSLATTIATAIVGRFSGGELSCVALSLAQLGVRNAEFFGAAAVTMTALRGGGGGAEVAAAARSFPGDLIPALRSSRWRRIDLLNPQELANLMAAYAISGYVDELLYYRAQIRTRRLLNAAAVLRREAAAAARGGNGSTAAVAAAALRRGDPVASDDMSAASLIKLLWAFVAVGVQEPPLLRALAGQLRQMLQRLEPRDIAALAWGLAVARLPECDELLTRAVRAASEHARAFAPADLATVAWAAATAGLLNRGLMDACARLVLDAPPPAGPGAAAAPGPGLKVLSDVAWAHSALRLYNPLLLDRVAELAKVQLAAAGAAAAAAAASEVAEAAPPWLPPDLELHHVVALLEAHATWAAGLCGGSGDGCYHDGLFRAAAAVLLSRLDELTSDEVVTLTWCCTAVLHALPPAPLPPPPPEAAAPSPAYLRAAGGLYHHPVLELLKALSELLAATPSESFLQPELEQLAQAHAMSVEYGRAVVAAAAPATVMATAMGVQSGQLPLPLPPALMKRVTDAWNAAPAARTRRLVVELCAALDEMGFRDVQIDGRSEDGLVPVDVAATGPSPPPTTEPLSQLHPSSRLASSREPAGAPPPQSAEIHHLSGVWLAQGQDEVRDGRPESPPSVRSAGAGTSAVCDTVRRFAFLIATPELQAVGQPHVYWGPLAVRVRLLRARGWVVVVVPTPVHTEAGVDVGTPSRGRLDAGQQREYVRRVLRAAFWGMAGEGSPDASGRTG
ncbi:hypothetical protein VOLCADRAFT_119621 [Volvox carteri f. nagariensis]|uniref:RAP domain-containing protein n=1 Tax=Volvox carteri f. nagariensis TaxID=3068 RepID=D8UF12_VOLCA|nr:uncharacterized protein VOLCADRAFT_119621 [Volvox carteri f. nagariensis]EFJ41736.1 hypothetical protein VOLCADRAFT_119621 [Volvox carteri f. nagariensis]|eukprot:XP_002957238.1 hypothetical protein VOLCADRAFT_119621 [Volvox carteri f. nagariensis]